MDTDISKSGPFFLPEYGIPFSRHQPVLRLLLAPVSITTEISVCSTPQNVNCPPHSFRRFLGQVAKGDILLYSTRLPRHKWRGGSRGPPTPTWKEVDQ